ncbi:hypothetical protein D3C85_978130 [compost metagenome]
MTQQNDFCTLFPERILQYDISQCCKAHDDAYSIISVIPRYEADIELMNCVKEAFPTNTFLAITIPLLMFAGVAVFGGFFYKKK